jgi:acetyl-CoA acetyltransferase
MSDKARSVRKSYDGVVAVAPVSVSYQRYSTQSAHWWIGSALKALSEKTGLGRDDFDGFSASSFTLFPDTAVGLTQHFGLSPRWLDHIPMGGASGVVALRRAARAVQCGDADIVACVAGDANHVSSFRNMVSSFSRFSQDAAYPYGSGGPNGSFALMTRAYMKTYGATREDFGKICIAQRDNALKYPHALMKKPLTMGDYLAARPIADPIHLFDCVMPCAGAEAFAVMREDMAKSLGLPFARILSTIERHNAFGDDPIQTRGGWAVDKDELWAMAGVAPARADFLQTYDDYPVISMMQFEDLGFCNKGEAKDFVRSRTLTADGDFPHNTSGGQLSVGQAGAAGGYLGLVEALRQLTGEPLGARVKDARIGVVSGFGMINFDRGLCSAAAVLAGAGGHG